MRQPEDNKTMDMLEQKRGRGRPRKENALTPAERARRYRERKAELRDLLSRDAVKPVTENQGGVPLGYGSYFCEIHGWNCGNGAECFDQVKAELLELRKASENCDVTENSDDEDADFWRGMFDAQVERTVELQARIAASRGNGWTYGQLTEAVEAFVIKWMSDAESDADFQSKQQKRDWAFGAYLFWSSFASRHMLDGERERMFQLTR